MRSTWRAPVFAMVLGGVASGTALAQGDEPMEEGFGGTEVEDEAIAPSSPDLDAEDPAAEGGAEPTPAAPEAYVVQPGDTLWQLSERFLNNPWYWPKIWSYNPGLTNPNWIQPGTRIRFYPGATESAPIEVEPAPDADVIEAVGDDDFSDDFVDVPLFQDQGVKPRQVPEANAETGRREFFLSDKELEAAGRIRNSPEEKGMLSQYDSAYFDMKEKPRPGQMVQLFEVARDLRHPITGANLGKVVHTVGVARVERVTDEQHLGTLVETWDVIERGTLVGDLGSGADIASVKPTLNDRTVRGYIVDTARFPTASLGQNHMVFIDRGRADGVKLGNSFTVVRAGDPFTGELRGMADEDIGKLLVIDVAENGSTAVIIASARELVAGDRIEMRRGE
ncbi:MAG: LysM peptidoglycan-binding domain-containing protein [Myxococcota bacterium]